MIKIYYKFKAIEITSQVSWIYILSRLCRVCSRYSIRKPIRKDFRKNYFTFQHSRTSSRV